ncbi:MAG: hypothetical protein IT289_12460 [Oligoflexia bacterium]|nr:hypothetical protein [Oligoflexia bacterium]
MMKFALVLVATFYAFSATAGNNGKLKYSKYGPKQAEVLEAIEEIRPILFQIKDVNGVGISACEELSGRMFSDLTEEEINSSIFELCILVSTETDQALKEVEKTFPPGKKFGKVLVATRKIGVITIEH